MIDAEYRVCRSCKRLVDVDGMKYAICHEPHTDNKEYLCNTSVPHCKDCWMKPVLRVRQCDKHRK